MATYELKVTCSSQNHKRAEVSLRELLQNPNDRAIKYDNVERLSKTRGKRDIHYGLLDDETGVWCDKGFRGRFVVTFAVAKSQVDVELKPPSPKGNSPAVPGDDRGDDPAPLAIAVQEGSAGALPIGIATAGVGMALAPLTTVSRQEDPHNIHMDVVVKRGGSQRLMQLASSGTAPPPVLCDLRGLNEGANETPFAPQNTFDLQDAPLGDTLCSMGEAANGAVDNVVENGLAGNAAEKVQTPVAAVNESPKKVQGQLTKLIGSLESCKAKDAVVNIVNKGKDALSLDQMNQLVGALGESFGAIKSLDLGGCVEAVAVATFAVFATVSDMAPDIVNVASEVLIGIGPHLPMIGVACGALGIVAYTFKLSKDQDDNVKAVTLWTNSIKDWLFLVADKVGASSAKSTIPLFQGLQEALLSLSEQVSARDRKWRVSKMLTSATFKRDFTRAKEIVLELKTALRDFVDQEAQDRQERALAVLEATNLATTQKLFTMDDQLGAIMKKLTRIDEREKGAFRSTQEEVAFAQSATVGGGEMIDFTGEQEEAIFVNLQRVAGVEGDVPFARFVIAFEALFYNGDDIPPEQKRGLKLSLDPGSLKIVSKPAWMKFYKKWTGTRMNIEEYLNKIADNNPTMPKQALAMRPIFQLKRFNPLPSLSRPKVLNFRNNPPPSPSFKGLTKSRSGAEERPGVKFGEQPRAIPGKKDIEKDRVCH